MLMACGYSPLLRRALLMVVASQLRPGTVIQIGDDLFKVVESVFHVGQGKMPGSVHAKLRHVLKGSFKEQRFRPEERRGGVLVSL